MFGRRNQHQDEPQLRQQAQEPRTVVDAQRWLSHHGFNEITEGQALYLLRIRTLVRDGGLSDDR